MRKEVVAAILLGIIAGLIITFGVYTARTAMQRRAAKESPLPGTQQTSESSTQQKTSILIFSPEDNLLTDKSTLQVSGTTPANANIVVFVNDEEHITTADAKGNFSVDVTLVGGSNIITVLMIDANGKQEQEQRTVVFSTVNLDDAPPATGAAKPKASASPAL